MLQLPTRELPHVVAAPTGTKYYFSCEAGLWLFQKVGHPEAGWTCASPAFVAAAASQLSQFTDLLLAKSQPLAETPPVVEPPVLACTDETDLPVIGGVELQTTALPTEPKKAPLIGNLRKLYVGFGWPISGGTPLN